MDKVIKEAHMNIVKLPKMIPEKECKRLLSWIDSLEIQEVKQLEDMYRNKIIDDTQINLTWKTFNELIENIGIHLNYIDIEFSPNHFVRGFRLGSFVFLPPTGPEPVGEKK